MRTGTATTGRVARLHGATTDFARTSLGLLPIVLALRLYERYRVGDANAMPWHATSTWLHAVASDAALACWAAALLAVPVVLLARWSVGAARTLHRVALVLIALASAALAEYFAVTQVPLGADLFGYQWRDIRETVGASADLSPAVVLGLLGFAVAAWVIPGAMRRLAWPPLAGAAFGAVVMLGVCTPSLLVPPATHFASDAEYYAAVNKTGWLGYRSVQHVVSAWRTARAAAALRGYPLLRRVDYEDVLGPHLALTPKPPNIVIVIVEGLGRDFTGPNARFGGFTPFLDSLADRSLSWDNFLSTSGRTFGILPSLLGSLPFGPSGFMEFGSQMPAHASLVSVLRQQGYAANYFTGTNGYFDNIDVFMERQGVDRFVDAASFGPPYEKEPASPGGESWGYPDGALFARSLELLGDSAGAPRLDVYLTISSHEPFLAPNRARYRARFERRLARMSLPPSLAATYRAYGNIFETLLYVDDALRGLFTAYAARADYCNTIFVITGDHRLIPVPPSNRLSRYHVPFIVASPMLRAPRRIGAVSSHFDVTPSLLALLKAKYGLRSPDSAAWMGNGLDTAARFRHRQAVPLMRAKNELDDFLLGPWFVSGAQLFRIDSTFAPRLVTEHPARDTIAAALQQFRAVNRYVTARDRIVPATMFGVVRPPDPALAQRDDSVFHALHLERRTPDAAFTLARELAAAQEFEAARAIARTLLRDAPSYHDARALLGRTYGWQRRFDEARAILRDLVRRAPGYADGYAALAELDVYQGNGEAALAAVNRALASFPGNVSLLYLRARALELLDRRAEALGVLDALQRLAPGDSDAASLRRRLLAR
jgi:phosphoglycerol transferase MdoB-like AlkP superfamily enzyme